MCCKTMGVVELEKPSGTWCVNCAIGKGCKIYDARPESCRNFTCLWLAGYVPLQFKPDAVRAVITTWPEVDGIVVNLEQDKYDQVGHGPFWDWIEAIARHGVPIAVVCGDRKEVVTLDETKRKK